VFSELIVVFIIILPFHKSSTLRIKEMSNKKKTQENHEKIQKENLVIYARSGDVSLLLFFHLFFLRIHVKQCQILFFFVVKKKCKLCL
jgi:hypothetical protein